MPYTNLRTIISLVGDEVVARIIALTFIQLREVVPTGPISRVREVVDAKLRGVSMREGTSFSMMVKQLAASWDGDKDVVSNVDEALKKSDHIRYQIKEIAGAISPIVIQTIRLLDVFQDKANEILLELQQEITNKITNDETRKNFDIRPIDLGVLDDADALSTAEAIASGAVPDPASTYRSHEYKLFAQRVPYKELNKEQLASLSKFLFDHHLAGDEMRLSLVNDIVDRSLFPDDIRDPKTHADRLSSLWEKASWFNEIIDAEGSECLLDEDIKQNVRALLHRVGLAVHWGRQVIDHNHKNSLIVDRDANTIYVYPWSYNAFKLQEAENADEIIKDFIRSKNVTQINTPTNGWSIDDVRISKERVKNILAQYTRHVVMNQEAHTKKVIRDVCHDKLNQFPLKEINTIINDLATNSSSTLQDILGALIIRAGDYYLDVLEKATLNQEFSYDNETDMRINTIIIFLAQVARDKIVDPK